MSKRSCRIWIWRCEPRAILHPTPIAVLSSAPPWHRLCHCCSNIKLSWLCHFLYSSFLQLSSDNKQHQMLLIHLPVELIADILSELDLASLIAIAQSNKHLYCVVSDPYLNPWKKPIIRNLHSPNYEACLRTLSVRTLVPRRNWLDILSLARPEYLLLEACLPNLGDSDWQDCFRRRFLPSWTKWHREGKWRGTFIKCAYACHRPLVCI